MDNYQFQNFLNKNVVECWFKRRHPKKGYSGTRGALITASAKILNSANGSKSLHYRPPSGIGMPYNPLERNCVTAWDILRGDWRVFSCESVEVNKFFPVVDTVDILKFWGHFNDFVIKITPKERLAYMGKL